MNLKGILSVATYPGLYKHVAQAKNGLIIESLVDGKKCLAYATSRISALEDISIYTTDGDIKLSEVYQNMFKVLDGKPTPFNPKKASTEELTDLFTKSLANWDKDRVYTSDIKRAFTWYNLLLEKGLIDANSEDENQETEPKKEETAKEEKTEPKKEENSEGGITVKKRTRKKKEE
ncbi:MAG: DUF5606 domain-containing protein [Bacteroidales bacterium]|nr:DUF5606 domain-containing protein [Bacteroidales bacterium]